MDKLVFLIVFAVVITEAISAPVEQGGCCCGVFPENNPIPIFEQKLQYSVSCDAEGDSICQTLCSALAQGARDQAPALICEKFSQRVENLKVAVFTKTECSSRNEWKFTGLKSPEAICCDSGKVTVCDTQSIAVDDFKK